MMWKTGQWTAAAERTEAELCGCVKYSGGALKGYTHTHTQERQWGFAAKRWQKWLHLLLHDLLLEGWR